jgi:hypothetical protein
VQFRPFVETAEFANVGIVMMSPQGRFIDFRLIKRYRRVTQFFHQLDRKVYLEAMEWFREELGRATRLIKYEALDGRRTTVDETLAHNLFGELIRARENLIRFDEPRIVLAENPAQKLDELFAHYVERNFVTKAYQERLLENEVKRWLYQAQLSFIPARVGNEEYSVRFPFVHQDEAGVHGVIKPLHLAHAELTKLYDHGDEWVGKLKRLRKLNRMPANILFALNAPDQTADTRYKAFKEIEGELIHLGARVTRANNRQDIIQFASANQ